MLTECQADSGTGKGSRVRVSMPAFCRRLATSTDSLCLLTIETSNSFTSKHKLPAACVSLVFTGIDGAEDDEGQLE